MCAASRRSDGSIRICLDKTGTLTEGRIELDLVSDGRDALR